MILALEFRGGNGSAGDAITRTMLQLQEAGPTPPQMHSVSKDERHRGLQTPRPTPEIGPEGAPTANHSSYNKPVAYILQYIECIDLYYSKASKTNADDINTIIPLENMERSSSSGGNAYQLGSEGYRTTT